MFCRYPTLTWTEVHSQAPGFVHGCACRCRELSTQFIAVYQTSSVVKGILNAVTMGVGDSIDDAADAVSDVGETVPTHTHTHIYTHNTRLPLGLIYMHTC